MTIAKPPFPRLQRGHPLTRGLLGCYPFFTGAGAGTVYDIGRQKSHFDTVAGTPTWIGSPYGHAMRFDGSSAAIGAYQAGTDTADFGFTIHLLARLLDASATRGIFSWEYHFAGEGTANHPFALLQRNNGDVRVYLNGNYRFTKAVSTNVWKLFSLTRTPAGINTFYIDGASQGTYDDGGTPIEISTATKVSVGWGYNGYCNCDVAGLWIYNVCHDSSLVRQMGLDPFAMTRNRRVLKVGVAVRPYSYGFIFS
jgi:hypothetical protein